MKSQITLRLNEAIYTRLISESVPRYFTELRVGKVFEVTLSSLLQVDGKLVCEVKHEFSVSLTLMENITSQAPWTLVDMAIYVQPEGPDYKRGSASLSTLTSLAYVGHQHSDYLRRLTNDKMNLSKTPFRTLYGTMRMKSTKLRR